MSFPDATGAVTVAGAAFVPLEVVEEADEEMLPESEETRYESPRPSSRIPVQSSRATLSRTPIAQQPTAPLFEDEEESILITELKFEDEAEQTESEASATPELEDEEDVEENADVDIVNQVTIETVDVELKDEDYDTDLEDEFTKDEEDSVKCQYAKVCEDLGVTPISYFVRHIRDKDISMKYHNLASDEVKAIALVLKETVHVEKLNISGNWIKDEGGYAISRMLEENDCIAELGLADNKLSNASATHLCQMLNVNAGLRKLDLSGNDFDDAVAEQFADILENNKYLRELDLSKNKFDQVGGEILGPAIGSNDVLDVLDLSWNHLRQKGAIAVAKGIKENMRLKVCRLAWNGFGTEGGSALADALAAHESLLELDISGNRLALPVAKTMAQALSTNDTLKTLRMGNNLITTAGAIALVSAIHNSENSQIELLDITDVPVEYEFLRVIEDIKLKKPGFTVIHGPIMRSGNTLEDIGKKPIDPYRKNKEPVIILQEHIVVNDMRLIDILKRYDPDKKFSVTPEQFLSGLDELAVPYNRQKLEQAVELLAKDQLGRIYFGDYASLEEIPVDDKRKEVGFVGSNG